MDLLPGFCSGLTRVAISYPPDVIKTICQKENTKPWPTFTRVIQTNPGLLYRGVPIPLLTVSIERAIQFKYFETLKTKYGNYPAGFLMGSIGCIFSVPMLYITSNIVLSKNYNGLAAFFSNLKPQLLFKGYFIDVFRNCCATSVYLGTYAHLRDGKINKIKNKIASTSVNAVVASWISWLVVYPLDTCRVLYQTDTIHQKFATLVWSRICNHGMRSLWRGITPVLLRTIPSSVAGMLVYEKVRTYITN